MVAGRIVFLIAEVFGDLANYPRFVEAYLWALESLHRDGSRATLAALLKEAS